MRRAFLVLLAIPCAPQVAHSQTRIGEQAGSRTIDALAGCNVLEQKSAVVAALATPRDYKHDTVVTRDLTQSPCVPSGISVSIGPMIYRGALARAMVRADASGGPLELYAYSARETDTWFSIMGFADCVVRADPAISYDLVVAEAGSKAEKVAFKGLSGEIDRCKPWQSMSWQKDALISFFSEAYYRASRADAASSN